MSKQKNPIMLKLTPTFGIWTDVGLGLDLKVLTKPALKLQKSHQDTQF